MQSQSPIPVFICLILLFTGCEKYIDYDGDDAPSRLVVNGTFAPDSVFRVELSRSMSYLRKGNTDLIPGGKVAVFDNAQNFIDSLHHQGNGWYTGNVAAETGKTYTVRASAPALGDVYGTDVIPSPVSILSTDTHTISVKEYDYTYDKLEVAFTFHDPPEVANFYVVELFVKEAYYLTYVYDPDTGDYIRDTVYYENPVTQRTGFTTADPVLLADVETFFDETYYYASQLAFNDQLFNGKTQTFRIQIDTYGYGSNYSSLILRLTSCSEAYYRYLITLQKYTATEGDPFAQPVQIFTNIENGRGIWAGYAFDEADI